MNPRQSPRLVSAIVVFVLTVLAGLTVSCEETFARQVWPDKSGRMLLVPSGTFEMGDRHGRPDETMVHQVTVGPFWLGTGPVTVEEWSRFDTAYRSRNAATSPVSAVTWNQALAYCNWKSLREGLRPVYQEVDSDHPRVDAQANGYRLPTEAEWEWAASGATISKSFRYAGSNDPSKAGWFMENATGPQPVGAKAVNELGLSDLSGNVREWCWDYYGMYDFRPARSPAGPAVGTFRVLRGGSWRFDEEDMRVKKRYFAGPAEVMDDVGFRMARNAAASDESDWKAVAEKAEKREPVADSRFRDKAPADAPYRNSRLSPEQRADDLLSRMTVAEKAGQMTQLARYALNDSPVAKSFIGSVLSGGGDVPGDHGPEALKKLVDTLQSQALGTRLSIPILYGIDAVHGHNNIRGAVIYPHNIGLGASGDPDLVRLIGESVRGDLLATGVRWDFAPCLAVPQNERWGRTYEGFGGVPELAGTLGAAFISGLQGGTDGPQVAATAKHFFADGGTSEGIDRGDAKGRLDDLEAIHLTPYFSAVKAGVLTVMVSFSSINGQPMHTNHELVTDLLKSRMGFGGVVVSDWGAWKLVPGDTKKQIADVFNAGVDMMMVPDGTNSGPFADMVVSLIQDGALPLQRVDDAVRRILILKFKLGIFEHPFIDPPSPAQRQQADVVARALARRAAAESAVVLKNQNALLPLKNSHARTLLLCGPFVNDTAAQCGGWTLDWQGARGPVPGATSLGAALEARAVAAGWKVIVSTDGSVAPGQPAPDVAVAFLGETPYAEMEGDRTDLHLPASQSKLVDSLAARRIPAVAVLVSGRPLIVTKELESLQAFVAVWLPGSEGAGVADILWGELKPTGKLPRIWPRDMGQIGKGQREPDALFPLGYGLSW